MYLGTGGRAEEQGAVNMTRIIGQSIIIAAGGVMILPLIGLIIHGVVTGILQRFFGLISRSGALYLFFANTLTFPGVMYHELSHALLAFVTGARINEIRLYQKREGHLGYVNYTPRGPWAVRCLQLSLASCAPVITGIIAIAGIIFSFMKCIAIPAWGRVILIYLGVSVLIHMDMSYADLKSYVKGIPFFLLLIFVISVAYQYFT